jgi:hypothetical protein
MANKKVQIQIDTKATGSGAKQTIADLNKVAAAAEQTEARTTKAAIKGGSKKSQIAGQIGLQVQDIAVQAQAGTAATTILAQQGSQLLGIFGPTGAILGGILAIGSAAAGVFLKMGDDTQTAAEKADKLKDALEEVKKNAEKLKSSEIDMGRQAVDEAITLVNTLRQAYEQAEAAEQKYSDSALQNVEALRIAEVELRRLRGEEINEIAEAGARQEYNQKLVEQKREQELRAAEERKAAALQEQSDAQELLRSRAHALIVGQEELDQRIAQLEALRLQKAELEKIAAQRITPGSTGGYATSVKPRKTPAALTAETALGGMDAQFQQLQGQIDALSKATTEQGGELYNGLIQAAQKLADAQAKLPAALQTFEAEAARINEAASVEQIKAAVQGSVDVAKQQAAEVNALIKEFVPANEQQAQALAEIKSRTVDLKVDAEEAPIVARNLAVIKQALSLSNAEAAKNSDEIIKSLQSQVIILKLQNDRIRALQSYIKPIQ